MASLSDLAVWFIAGQMVLASIALLGGIMSLILGYRLFGQGYGAAPDKARIRIGGLAISMTTIGTAVMAMSIPWGTIGYLIAPNEFSLSDSEIKIARIEPLPMSTGVDSLLFLPFPQAEYGRDKAMNLGILKNDTPVNIALASSDNKWTGVVTYGPWEKAIGKYDTIESLVEGAMASVDQIASDDSKIGPASKGWVMAQRYYPVIGDNYIAHENFDKRKLIGMPQIKEVGG